MGKKYLILGPSHIMRWVQSQKFGLIPNLTNTDFYGKGGASIWGDFIKSKKSDFNLYDEIIFIVGDFRFGNRILNDSTLYRNQFGIGKALINSDNDRELYRLAINELIELSQSDCSQKIKFIFWDLALRESENKRLGKYFDKGGNYSHPIWNLSSVQDEFSDNTIRINEEDDKKQFFIDKSNHPSLLGYKFLFDLIFKGDSNCQRSIDIYPEFFLKNNHIVGDSVIIRNVNSFCNKNILPEKYRLKEVKIDQIEDFLLNNSGKVVYVSNIRFKQDNEQLFISSVERLHRIKSLYGDRVDIVFWEAFSQEIISGRESGYEKFNPSNILYRHYQLASLFGNLDFYPDVDSYTSQSLVELNVGLQPTLKAILWLFMLGSEKIVKLEERYNTIRDSIFYEY